MPPLSPEELRQKNERMQAQVNAQTEPPFKQRLIDRINKMNACRRSGLLLRLPQPKSVGDCLFYLHIWSAEEAARYLADGTLPRDLTALTKDDKCLPYWFFDATAAGGLLPEVEIDPLPDFETTPAMCVFDLGDDTAALIKSTYLEMRPTGPQKVQFWTKAEKSLEAHASIMSITSCTIEDDRQALARYRSRVALLGQGVRMSNT